MKTWVGELAAVSAVLATVAIASGEPIELLGATTVALSFAHAQVATRFAEREMARPTDVDHAMEIIECHRWTGRYFLAKELAWCGYFVVKGSWSALAGVALFLAYPMWRRFHLSRRSSTRDAS